MTLAEQITLNLTESMKAGTAERTSTLRLLKSAIKNEEIKLGHPLSQEETLKLLQAQSKQRRDSIEAYQKAGRSELAADEAAELAIIAEYLPQPLTTTELEEIVARVVSQTGATEIKQMGTVIGLVMRETAGKAEGSDVSRLVKTALEG